MRRSDVPRVLPLERDLFGAEAWTGALFHSELDLGASRWYVVAEQAGEVVGYGGLCEMPDEAYVQTLAVRRDRWGRGLGGWLLDRLLAEADRRGRPVVGLEVRADNRRAQHLYTGRGFQQVAVRRGYYQPSGVDALIMQRAVPDAGPAGPR